MKDDVAGNAAKRLREAICSRTGAGLSSRLISGSACQAPRLKKESLRTARADGTRQSANGRDMTVPLEPAASASGFLPSGTVTFLFSDIEGSTQRWERDREAMRDALQRHDALLRARIEAHGGRVFKTVGDAFCAVFARAEDAIAGALEVQRALAAADFSAAGGVRVRMALHTGTADERDGDYFGRTVNRIARLLAIGHGGQVLISGATAELARGDMPTEATLHDLGAHRLKDLARPERVYQLVAPDLLRDFPPLRSLDVLPNNLPPQLTSFVGRATEVAEIGALIAPRRVVTIVGSGGVGKTRTSLEVGANLLDGSNDGVWFVELAPIADPALVPITIAGALGLILPAEGDPLDALVKLLRPKHCLLILDNCEHLVEAAAAAASAIVRGCPGVAILASSRQRLGIEGERTYRMPSLALPSEAEAERLTAAGASAYGAIALFIERAGMADKHFLLSDESAPIVADICRRLDGVALAIELAAARVAILRPRELRTRLDQRFRVLTGGRRDALPRQQTLHALIDWSFDLLDERERRLFRRLGIFVNGFTLEAAAVTAVDDVGDETGSDERLDEFTVFDVLASLVDKSLVVAEPEGETTRYRLLESMRAYAREKLDAACERERLAECHLRYLRDVFVRVGEAFEQMPRDNDVLALAVELDDARAALEWAAQSGRATLGGELYVATLLWDRLGLQREAFAIAERYVPLLERADTALRSRAFTQLSYAALALLRLAETEAASERAVSLARESGDPLTLSWALIQRSNISIWHDRYAEASAELSEAETVAPLTARMRLMMVIQQSWLARLKGDFAEAARLLERYRAMDRAFGNASTATLLQLAELEHQRGNTEDAIAHIREALVSAAPGKLDRLLPYLYGNLPAYLLAIDDLSGACIAGRNALNLLRKTDPDGIIAAIVIEHVSLAAALAGDLHAAARLEGYADANFRAAGYARDFTERTSYDRLRALLRERLTTSTLEELLAEGAGWDADTAITQALEAIAA